MVTNYYVKDENDFLSKFKKKLWAIVHDFLRKIVISEITPLSGL